jgi:hypothetical protein
MENILANKAEVLGKTAEAAKMLVESLSQMKVIASDAEASVKTERVGTRVMEN